MKNKLFKAFTLFLALMCLLSVTANALAEGEHSEDELAEIEEIAARYGLTLAEYLYYVDGIYTEEELAELETKAAEHDLTLLLYLVTYDARVYEGDFAVGEVVVCLKKDAEQVEDYIDLFPEVKDQIESIGEDIIKYDSGETMMRIILVEKTREAVVDVIGILKDNPNVKTASPNSQVSTGTAGIDDVVGPIGKDGKPLKRVTAPTNEDLVTVARIVVGEMEQDSDMLYMYDHDWDNSINNLDLVHFARLAVGLEG